MRYKKDRKRVSDCYSLEIAIEYMLSMKESGFPYFKANIRGFRYTKYFCIPVKCTYSAEIIYD